MYVIKQVPGDFRVFEISKFEISGCEPSEGPYLIYRLKKLNWNTLDVISIIAKNLHIPVKNIGFAGNKDKHALTEQFISIKAPKSKVDLISLKDVELRFICNSEERINLGYLDGNRFEIIVRNLDMRSPPDRIRRIVNYFDEQRFSTRNVEIGRLIVKKDFKGAVDLLDPGFKDRNLGNIDSNNFIGALRSVPKRLMRLYMHAYQSFLWNQIAAGYISKNYKVSKIVPYSLGEFVFSESFEDIMVDIPGFGAEFCGVFGQIASEVLKREGIVLRDFIIREFPEISSEGNKRSLFAEVKNLDIGQFEDDEFNPGKDKCLVSFTLPKGSYATLVIKRLLT